MTGDYLHFRVSDHLEEPVLDCSGPLQLFAVWTAAAECLQSEDEDVSDVLCERSERFLQHTCVS